MIDLLRTAEHQCLFGSFASTKQVASHRLRISEADQLDAAVEALLREAYETVGPGTRNLH